MASNKKNELFELTRKQEFMSGFRVIHLHPTLRCNLKCKHCYSNSSSEIKTGLNAKDIINFLEYAYEYNFNALSISGGEPFLYKGLHEILEKSKELGFKNSVASNGMLLKSERVKRTLKKIDLMAISIDGDKALHNEIRSFNKAYEKMIEGVNIIKEQGIDFGFIHTVTPRSWEKLIELSDLAFKKGAKLIQFHPLELYGRAIEEMPNEQMGQDLLHKVFIVANYLKSKYQGKMNIQLDVLHKEHILKYPETVAYFGNKYLPKINEIASALKTIIVDEVGDIYPISYGFSKKYLIGNIKEVSRNEEIFERFLNKWEEMYSVIESTFNQILENENDDMVVWTELIVKNSRKKPV